MASEREDSLKMLRDVHEDGYAVINGRAYHITKLTHSQRRAVFAFFSSISGKMSQGDFSFLTSQEFAKVEALINNVVTFEGCLISKLPDHWEIYPGDYMLYISSMMGAISYPFLEGMAGS